MIVRAACGHTRRKYFVGKYLRRHAHGKAPMGMTLFDEGVSPRWTIFYCATPAE